jgi:hypothetical protein
MAYIRKSVASPGGISPGSPKPKNANVTILFVEDILSWPTRDASGIKYEGNFVMKSGASMIQVYMTAKRQKPGYTGEGEVDEEVIKQTFEGAHPGNSLDIREFIQNCIGKDVVIMSGDCQGSTFDVYGTPCSPMRMKPTGVLDDTRTGHDMVFEQSLGTGYLPALYEGTLSFAAPFAAADENLALTIANGTRFKIPTDTLGTALDVASIDHEHGTVLSLIGSGGSDPMVLSGGAATAATVILKDNTDWAAAENAVIDLKVYKAGATTYLIEQKRA